MECKRCGETNSVKNGVVRGKQRWRCKSCSCNFTQGDLRKERCSTQQRALAILLVNVGLSFQAAGRVVGVVRNTVMVWFRSFAQSLDLPEIEGTLDEVEMDEMWHFIQKKRTNAGSGKPQRLVLVQLDSSMSRWGIVAVEL